MTADELRLKQRFRSGLMLRYQQLRSKQDWSIDKFICNYNYYNFVKFDYQSKRVYLILRTSISPCPQIQYQYFVSICIYMERKILVVKILLIINFNIKITVKNMLADYVMRSIDNLFTDKLFASSHSRILKHNTTNTSAVQPKTNFNKETIKNTLPNVIRKDGSSKSPIRNKQRSPSPISKSRLKCILENNRVQKIKSVVKRPSHIRQSSPYTKIEIDTKHKEGQEQANVYQDLSNKENNMIKYYREQRKSTEKYRGYDKTQNKHAKSRIFMKGSIISRQASTSNFH